MLYLTYFLIIVTCLVASFLNSVSRQNLLYIYFSFIVSIEMGHYIKLVPVEIYNSSPLFFILFFKDYFKKQIKSKKKLIESLGTIAFIISVCFYSYEGFDNYSTLAGTLMSVLYIVYALLWLLSQIINTDENPILKKQTFWVSSSLLIWAVFFIFRSIPMYWLNNNDIEFLIQINSGFQIITIFSYLLFLRGLFVKYE